MHSKEIDFHFRTESRNANESNTDSIPKVKRLLALAYHYDKILAENPNILQNMLSSLLPITRVRFTQILNLNFLSNRIKTEVMNLPNTTKGKDPISTKSVVNIAQELDWERQEERWDSLKLKKGVIL